MKCSECGNVGPCPQCEPEKFAERAGETIPREVADRLAKALEMCAANDKTEYDYSGKARLNRNGAAPEMPFERFKTPREIAADAIAEYRKAVSDGR